MISCSLDNSGDGVYPNKGGNDPNNLFLCSFLDGVNISLDGITDSKPIPRNAFVNLDVCVDVHLNDGKFVNVISVDANGISGCFVVGNNKPSSSVSSCGSDNN